MVIVTRICILWLAFLGSIRAISDYDDYTLSPPSRHHHAPHPPQHQAHDPCPPHLHAHISSNHDYALPSRCISKGSTYDVTSFGAVGDGKTDDSKAFKSAWNAACKTKSGNPKVTVPDGNTFQVSPVKFKGPCASPSITFEVLGSIVAPPSSAWKEKVSEWLQFYEVDGLTVVGNGQGKIDGRGETWWKQENQGSRPTAMRFSSCNHLHISRISHSNSQKNHISIDGCKNAVISDVKLKAPAKSPNTDGINIASSSGIQIRNSVIATGDDCIAFNGGSNSILVSNVHCGPGHGISIGSLGKHGGHDEVHSIHVSNCTFKQTTNGARIKTWQEGSGFARNITFEDITFVEADNPIIIDQHYCPHQNCKSGASAVKISDVKYIRLRGTAGSKDVSIDFRCSPRAPCTNILMEDVNIVSRKTSIYENSKTSLPVECENAHGIARDCHPAVKCLREDLDY